MGKLQGIISLGIIIRASGKLFNPQRTFLFFNLYFILKMWKWQKYVILLLNLLFAGCGLFLIYVYLKQAGDVWFQNVEVSRGLVLASGMLSIILCIPLLVLFTFFQSIGGIRKNPRGHLYDELFDLLDDNIQDGPNNEERFLGNFDDDVPPNPNLMPHHKTSENKVIKEKEKIRYEDLPRESVDNLINAITDNEAQKDENFKEINACLNALLNEPHVERLKTVEITQKHNEEYPEEELKFQERIETVVPPDFDISHLLTQPAEVLLEKLQIEKLGNLTD